MSSLVSLGGNMLQHYRLSGDARGIAHSMAAAKMRAASTYTRTRLYVTLGAGSAGSYRVDIWQKAGAGQWVTEGPTTTLSTGVSFGFGVVGTPPPNTQAAIGQAALCRDNLGATIAGTACVIFNSRGVPVDQAGAPTGTSAFYLTNGDAVYAATVSVTGLGHFWRTPARATPVWLAQ
jgi:hypothetical protein